VRRRPARTLRRRVVALGVGTLVGALVALDLFVALALRQELEDNVTALLSARLDLALELSATLPPEALADRLTEIGIPARVRTADGRQLTADPASPRFGSGAPAGAEAVAAALPPPVVSLRGPLPAGGEVEVFATRAGAVGTFRDLLLFEIGGSLLVVVLAGFALWRLTSAAFRPLDEIVSVARATAQGERGQRLRPSDTTSELGSLAADIDRMLDALEDSLRRSEHQEELSRRFLADAAHQLRTPVAGMRASVETLLRGSLDPRDRERLLVNLAGESHRVGRLVAGLLRVAELDRGEPTRPARLALAGIAADEVARAAQLDPSVSFALEDEGDGVVVLADEHGLREVLANLLDNARRHAAAEVVVRVSGSETWGLVEVADDGPGLPAGAEERVFERFVSLDGAGGSGLGLAIARGMARSSGGEVEWADGAMRVRLPLG
jgi:two-component system, OmpR family, sensor kinase